MANTRVVSTFYGKEYYLDDAAAQASREWYTPGKAAPSTVNVAQKLEQNWPDNTEFPVKTGVTTPDTNGLQQIRVLKTDRSIICDAVILAPTVTAISRNSEEGSAHSGTYLLSETNTQTLDGTGERRTGEEGVKP